MKGLLPSPSFRKNTIADTENKPPDTKKTGCMPSIFFFFHAHSRKRLSAASSSAKKANKSIAPPPPPQEQTRKPPQVKVAINRLTEPPSPRTPPSIRLSAPVNAGASSPDTPRRSPALVARLMGLDDLPVNSPGSSTAEKRRKLLGALEKCDEDFKALRAIIESLRVTETRRPSVERKEVVAVEEEQPSPVSVLDVQPAKGEKRKREGGFSLRATMERVPWRVCRRRTEAGKGRRWTSKATVESVGEVWKEGVWRHRRERGRVAVALEGGILGDLMKEIVEEMELMIFNTSSSPPPAATCRRPSLPFDSCRRRLRF